MEIWIVGGIIVALMIYASTKIKKAAASAYEREVIEAEDFAIVKPEGFISLVDSAFAFEAQSKEFGESEAAEDLYRARAWIAVGDATGDATSESDLDENGVAMREFGKTLTRDGRSFDLKIRVITDHLEEFRPQVREMLSSFQVK
jgi:hypothetical protein